MLTTPDLVNVTWRKSSYSANGSQCIEVAFTSDAVVVRDSKNPTGPALSVTPTDWTAFVQATRTGHLTPTD